MGKNTVEITWLDIIKDIEEKSRFINRLAQNAKDHLAEINEERAVNAILKLQLGYSKFWKSQLSQLLRRQRQRLNSFVAAEASTSSKSQSRRDARASRSQSESSEHHIGTKKHHEKKEKEFFHD